MKQYQCGTVLVSRNEIHRTLRTGKALALCGCHVDTPRCPVHDSPVWTEMQLSRWGERFYDKHVDEWCRSRRRTASQ